MALITIEKNDIMTLYKVILSVEDTAKVDLSTLRAAGFIKAPEITLYTKPDNREEFIFSDIDQVIKVFISNNIIIEKRYGFMDNNSFVFHRKKQPAHIDYDVNGSALGKYWYIFGGIAVLENSENKYVSSRKNNRHETKLYFNKPYGFKSADDPFFLSNLTINKKDKIIKASFVLNFDHKIKDYYEGTGTSPIRKHKTIEPKELVTNDYIFECMNSLDISLNTIDECYFVYKTITKEQLVLLKMAMI